MKKNKWADHYARRAKEEAWFARSVYKLEELDKKFRLFRPGNRVLDLGCSPGSWSQYASRKVGPKGKVIGIDLKKPRVGISERFSFVEADIFDLDLGELLGNIGQVDLVISDLAPKTSGARGVDAARSMTLAQRAMEVADKALKPGGKFVCKVFESGDTAQFRALLKERYREVKAFRPKAVRKGSREIYFVGITKKRYDI